MLTIGITPRQVRPHLRHTITPIAVRTKLITANARLIVGYCGKTGSWDVYAKPSTLEHGHLLTSRLASVSGKRRRRDVSRENRMLPILAYVPIVC